MTYMNRHTASNHQPDQTMAKPASSAQSV